MNQWAHILLWLGKTNSVNIWFKSSSVLEEHLQDHVGQSKTPQRIFWGSVEIIKYSSTEVTRPLKSYTMWKMSQWSFPHYARSSWKVHLSLFISSWKYTWLQSHLDSLLLKWELSAWKEYSLPHTGLLHSEMWGQRCGWMLLRRLKSNIFLQSLLNAPC